MLKGMDFYDLQKIFVTNSKSSYSIQDQVLQKLLPKTVHKAAEVTGEFIGKMTDKIVKPKYVINENSRNIEELIVPPEKREEILNKLRQVL